MGSYASKCIDLNEETLDNDYSQCSRSGDDSANYKSSCSSHSSATFDCLEEMSEHIPIQSTQTDTSKDQMERSGGKFTSLKPR